MEDKVSHLYRRTEHKEEQNLEAWNRMQTSIYSQHQGLDELSTRLDARLSQMKVNSNNRVDGFYHQLNGRIIQQEAHKQETNKQFMTMDEKLTTL